jgi:drug/metabolite transporter (DMT)-like permease
VGIAYIGLTLIWSTTPLAVVVSIRDFDAVWALSIRMFLAAVISSVFLRLFGLPLARDKAALKLYAVGSLSMFGAMLFTYLGARHLASGMIAVLFGLAPLLVGVLSSLFLPQVQLSALQWVGMLMGLLGLMFIFLGGGHTAAIDMASALLVLAGVFSYAVSMVWIKQMRQSLSPLVQTTGALWMSALGCALVLPFVGGPVPTHWPGMVTLVALLYSIVMGSIVAMLCYFFLLKRIDAGTLALTTLVTPVLALVLGMLMNHERFRMGTLGGMAMIFSGLVAYYEGEVRRLMARKMPAG